MAFALTTTNKLEGMYKCLFLSVFLYIYILRGEQNRRFLSLSSYCVYRAWFARGLWTLAKSIVDLVNYMLRGLAGCEECEHVKCGAADCETRVSPVPRWPADRRHPRQGNVSLETPFEVVRTYVSPSHRFRNVLLKQPSIVLQYLRRVFVQRILWIWFLPNNNHFITIILTQINTSSKYLPRTGTVNHKLSS